LLLTGERRAGLPPGDDCLANNRSGWNDSPVVPTQCKPLASFRMTPITARFTFALDEHRQFSRDFVVRADRQKTARSDKRLVFQIELRHDCFLPKGSTMVGPRGCAPGAEDRRTGRISLIKYGVQSDKRPILVVF
jgi:hypothetical protein